MRDALIVSALSLVPRKRGARAMGWFARSRLSALATRAFVKVYGVDMREASGEMADYRTLEDLFTRTLKPGSRPVDSDPTTLVSPVDGTVAFVGETQRGEVTLAPGQTLTLSELLGQPVDGERDVAVLYLSPRDYHRVHSPVDGTAVGWRYIPGTLWPVFPAAVRKVRKLFARNERVTIHVETERGPIDVVMVGAFGVGRITTSVCDLVTNTGGKAAHGELSPGVTVWRGGPLGVFHLGSTVILVTEPGTWSWQIADGDPVRMGERLARRPLLLEQR